MLTVDVTTNTGGGWRCLAVLAPHAISGLGVGEAIRVYNRENVEVVVVFEPSSRRIGGSQKLIRGIFNHLVHVSMTLDMSVEHDLTMVVIHSRACTVPCQTTPFFDPLPPLPHIWIPLMSRPSTDLPAEITSELLGYAAARSVIHCMWSAMEW